MIKIVIKMWEINTIDNNLLYKTTSIKQTPSGNLKKCIGSTAKCFANQNCGFIYPLWKTHKLSPEQLKQYALKQIPTRVVQAAGLSNQLIFLENLRLY